MPKIQRFAERPAGRRTGIKWGAVPAGPPVHASQVALEVVVASEEDTAHASQVVLEVVVSSAEDTAHASQVALEVIVEV